jgi:hypothetical protein
MCKKMLYYLLSLEVVGAASDNLNVVRDIASCQCHLYCKPHRQLSDKEACHTGRSKQTYLLSRATSKRGHALTPAQGFDHKRKNLTLNLGPIIGSIPRVMSTIPRQCSGQGVKNVWPTLGSLKLLGLTTNCCTRPRWTGRFNVVMGITVLR